MADADLQDPVPPPGSDPLSQPDNLLSNQDEFHTEHEAGDAGALEHPADTHVNHDAISEDVDVIADAPSDSTTRAQPFNAKEMIDHEAPDAKDPSKPKSGLTVKPTHGKTTSAPPTPLVKKIINSGTFGAGAVKPAPRSSVPAAMTKPTAAPLLKKSSSTSAAPKSAMATSRAPTSTVPPSRRSSVVPPKTAASTATKANAPPTASKPAPATSASARQSVVSPSGSVASFKSGAASHRPRASVSEGAKRATPVGTRPASSAPAKAPTGTTKAAPSRSSNVGAATKASGPSGSISSVHEINESSQEIRNKLKDATEELTSKAQVVSDLENRVQQLQTLLDEAQANIQEKASSVQELEHAKADLEVRYKGELDKQRDELNSSTAAQLTLADEKVTELQSTVRAKEELIESLSSQRSALEGKLLAATETLEAVHNTQVSASQAEREAVLKAEADLKATIAEIEALKSTHAQATETLNSKSHDLNRSASRIEELEIQINNLRTEREENATKVSELEVEILELRENQETLEDDRETVRTKVKNLEEQICSLESAAKQAEEGARSKAVEFDARIAELHSQHSEQLQKATDERAKVVETLETVQAALGAAQREHEQGRREAESAAQSHSQKLKEVEDSFLQQKTQLEGEIKKITAEFEGQEAKYNSQLDAVKSEHEVLLLDAFKRAKIEAGEEHAVELQNLRESSNSSIEQLSAANLARIEDLKAEHSSILESELKALEKRINNLNLELKATKDDLSKAKAAVDTARSEAENLIKQRDEALAAAASTQTSPEHLEEIARLTSELSRSKDDLHAVTDLLNLTKVSQGEMSTNHARELEEAAKARAEETTKLRAVHDADITTFAIQKSELSIKVSDLEGELATLRASISSDHPKSNGVSAPHPPSPDSTGVTREELQRIHEAHNLKMYDLQAEHERAIKALQEELKASQAKAQELQEEVSRKAMEIQYLEQDQEENQEQITRLQEDLEARQSN